MVINTQDRLFFPFSFISQFHHWKSSLDSPKGWRVYFCCTYSLRVNSVESQLCMQTSPLASPCCANLTFIFYHIPCQRMKNQKSCSLGDTYAVLFFPYEFPLFFIFALWISFLSFSFRIHWHIKKYALKVILHFWPTQLRHWSAYQICYMARKGSPHLALPITVTRWIVLYSSLNCLKWSLYLFPSLWPNMWVL